MPNPKNKKSRVMSYTLAEYLGALFADNTQRPAKDSERWAQLIADAMLRATGNAPRKKATKANAIRAMEVCLSLLSIARKVGEEGKRRAALLGAPKTPKK